jgi:hypothetical protein
MHIHGTHLNPNALNLYSAVAAEKAAAAKQAAEVRKKLLSSASKIEGEADTDDIPLIEEATEDDFPPNDDQAQDEDRDQEEHSPSQKGASNNEDAPEDDDSGDPISVWG